LSYELISNRPASTNGKLILEYNDRLIPELVLNQFSQYKEFLDEILLKGWRYLYIEVKGKYSLELELSGQECRIIPQTPDWYIKGHFLMEVRLEKPVPELKIKEVDEFRINISTRSFPRTVTLDLAKHIITYIEDCLWNWDDSWRRDKEKLSRALEVYEVVKWLLDEKNFQLHESLSEKKVKNLLRKFDEYKSRNMNSIC